MTDSQPGLFPEPLEVRVAKLDATILKLIMGHPGGALSLTLTDDERGVLRMLRFARGASYAVPLREIEGRTKLVARSIKQCVRNLRLNFSLPIGSAKSSSGGGYFLMVTPEDRAIWAKDVLDQVRAEVAVLRSTLGRQETLELLGQLRIETESDAAQAKEAHGQPA